MPLLFLSPLHRATRQIGIRLAARMATLGLQNAEGHLLSFLRSYAPVPISELGRVFGLRKSTLTSLLDRLERRGLLVRAPHPRDRRSFLVELTAAGRRTATEVQRPVDELEKDIRAAITDEDLRGFHRVLEAIGEVTKVQVRSPSSTPNRKETE
jgi:DNA-binding MarR family transcriptional regulator